MTNHPDLLKIGEFAKLAHTNLRTLRYYEELGLLRPAKRSEGGFRYYRPTDLNRVEMIHGLQELGLALERINEIMTFPDPLLHRARWVDRIGQALEEQGRLIDERVAALGERKRQIGVALEKLKLCTDCDHTPRDENNHCEPCSRTGDQLPSILSALF